MLWLLAFVPAVLAAERLAPESHTMLFVLSVLFIRADHYNSRESIRKIP
jgi:hypothetical protein